jgi:hypothetical protein
LQAEQEAGRLGLLDCQDAPPVDLSSAQLPPPEQEAQQQAQQVEGQVQQGILQIAKHTVQ